MAPALQVKAHRFGRVGRPPALGHGQSKFGKPGLLQVKVAGRSTNPVVCGRQLISSPWPEMFLPAAGGQSPEVVPKSFVAAPMRHGKVSLGPDPLLHLRLVGFPRWCATLRQVF